MCDLTSGITRAQRRLPGRIRPFCFRSASGATRGFGSCNPTRQCCVAFATPIDSCRALGPDLLTLSSSGVGPFGARQPARKLSACRGEDGKWLARGQNGVLTPTGRCAPQDRNCGILRQMRWDGSTKAAAPSSGTCCASSWPRRAPGQHKMAWHPHLLGAARHAPTR